MVLKGGLGGRREGWGLTMFFSCATQCDGLTGSGRDGGKSFGTGQTREFDGLRRLGNAFSQPQHAFFTEPKGKGSSHVGGDKGTPSSQGYRNGTFSQITLQQGQCLGIGVGRSRERGNKGGNGHYSNGGRNSTQRRTTTFRRIVGRMMTMRRMIQGANGLFRQSHGSMHGIAPGLQFNIARV